MRKWTWRRKQGLYLIILHRHRKDSLRDLKLSFKQWFYNVLGRLETYQCLGPTKIQLIRMGSGEVASVVIKSLQMILLCT